MKYMPSFAQKRPCGSLPVRGAWIEIFHRANVQAFDKSLPVRGAWIEMVSMLIVALGGAGRSPCGERGLKCSNIYRCLQRTGRSPCGERGLKWL